MGRKRRATGAPLMPEIGVLALVPDAWSTYWQPRHYVLCALARFFEVVWMNPPHARQEIGPRLRRPETSPSVRQTPSGFTVYTPEPWLPLFRRPRWLNDLTFRDRLRRARAIVKEKNCEKVIL